MLQQEYEFSWNISVVGNDIDKYARAQRSEISKYARMQRDLAQYARAQRNAIDAEDVNEEENDKSAFLNQLGSLEDQMEQNNQNTLIRSLYER